MAKKKTVVAEEVVENVTEVVESKTMFGTVFKCTKLNVRKKPDVKSSVLTTLSAGSEVTILEDSNKEWYKVMCGNISGYCMKAYIAIKA